MASDHRPRARPAPNVRRPRCAPLALRVLVVLVSVLVSVHLSIAAAASAQNDSEPPQDTAREGFADEITDEITVRAAPLRQSEERAQFEERESVPLVEIAAPDQLGRFPDRDAAAASRRLPGVTAISDQGDARHVLVRGFLPAYNSATLDGERIPAGEADERVVALDLVPTELLEAVELTKTPTPAHDGDAIGGTIDLVTRRPPRDGRRSAGASIGGGFDDGSGGDRALGTFSLGGWDDAGTLGGSLAASRLDADRGILSEETERSEGEIESVRLQDHLVRRDRSGASGSVEWLPNEQTSLLATGLWSRFDDLELRRALVDRRADDAVARELKDREEFQQITSGSLSSQHRIGEWLLFPKVTWSLAEEGEPDRLDTVFAFGADEEDDEEGEGEGGEGEEDEDGGEEESRSASFAARTQIGPPGVEDFLLEEFRTERDRAESEDLVAGLDAARSTTWGSWQVGAKWRRKHAERDDNLARWTLADGAEPVPMSAVAGLPGEFGVFPDQTAARDLFATVDLEMEIDPEESLGDYSAEETVSAGYAQLDWRGSGVSVLGGVRFESTRTSYDALDLFVDPKAEDDDAVTVRQVRGGGSYETWLPSVILRAEVGHGSVVRAALSRSLARPSLESLAPSRLVLIEDEEIVVGNPDLVPTTSWNLDLQWQRGLGVSGSVAVALYLKELRDVVAVVAEEGDPELDGLAGFRRLVPRNAGDATVSGVELSLRKRFRDLPAPFDGLGLQANLTWSDASADLVGRPSRVLPGQADLAGNVVLSYERGRVSARLLYAYRDTILEELGDTSDLDVYLDERAQLDLSLQVQLARRWSLFAEAFQLTDEPVRRYEGTPDRPIFTERGSWWATLGLRFDL